MPSVFEPSKKERFVPEIAAYRPCIVCIRWILIIAPPKMWWLDCSGKTNRIRNSRPIGLLHSIRRMATVQKLSKEKRADVDTTCGYFTAHAGRMKYDEYLAAGLPIATGVIEGACRQLVKDCLERTGMRWSATGAQAMLSLRCLKASDAWDDFQKQFLNQTPLLA